ncbi:hypothetical protein I6F35_02885 [Bradyrhizobium sp. BRP22]|uniref:hypothetical protein n=1 Tax=Bradyrhizobium sp. BRP22 TaxID=2793821 RepID=UPI001CD25167|nr:hypothetical protein [Bradyrhizobium sp. BRP22]MCA1452160.1 hypothetical protein [Bradyrhizobium sp. BRP22]
MKLYEVSGDDSGGPTTYYEPTKKAAIARKREMLREADDWDEINIKPMEISPRRCNTSSTCANEH